jgi:predicted metal-dependent hydrolase
MAAFVDLEATWGGRRLPFRLRRAEVRRLRIVIDPEGQVAVTAPLHATDEGVVARVSRRGDWIQRQREYFARWRPRTPVRQYLSGETHLFLGDQVRLQIEPEFAQGVSVQRDRLVVGLGNSKSPGLVRELVQAWYATQARVILRDRWHAQRGIWALHGVQASRVIVRALRNRWGSMTPAGSLVLNADLVRASPQLIDYVIAHEMAHLLHPDHGKEWRGLLTRVMSDWESRKIRLEAQLL